MGDVLVLETAQDHNDGVHLADIAQELIAESLALGRTAHETCDVDEFEEGRHLSLIHI